MASGSAFGFSGYDPIMSSVEGSINSFFDKKAENRSYRNQLKLMAKQYEYAQRYAENSPSWNVKGLRDAGLNPILAVSNGVNTASQAPSVPSAASHRSPNTSKSSFSASGLLSFDRMISKQNADSQSVAAAAASKQADAALLKAQTDRGESAQRVAKMLSEINLMDLEHKQRKDSNFQSPIVRDADSLIKRLINSASEGLSIFDGIDSYFQDNKASYLQHGPKGDSTQTRHAEIRLKREEEREEKSYWKTRKYHDGSPVYRRSGDIGGHIPIYR